MDGYPPSNGDFSEPSSTFDDSLSGSDYNNPSPVSMSMDMDMGGAMNEGLKDSTLGNRGPFAKTSALVNSPT